MTIRKLLVATLLTGSLYLTGCKNQSNPDADASAVSVDTTVQNPIDQDTFATKSVTANDSYENDNDNGGEACFEKSTFSLPYSQTLDPDKITYKTLPCEVEGVEEFLCNNRGLRYVPLPKFKDVDVVLVPMDCGDFRYRYVLLTIVQKKVVSNQYVEGEWYEPGSESYKELTRFAIDATYKITVTTNSQENGTTALKEKLVFQLQPNGKLQKL